MTSCPQAEFKHLLLSAIQNFTYLKLGFYVAALESGTAFDPGDCLFSGSDFDHGNARNQLLGLRKWPICDRVFSSGQVDASALCGWLQSFNGNQDAGFPHLVVIATHCLDEFGSDRRAGLHCYIGFPQNDKTHGQESSIVSFSVE